MYSPDGKCGSPLPLCVVCCWVVLQWEHAHSSSYLFLVICLLLLLKYMVCNIPLTILPTRYLTTFTFPSHVHTCIATLHTLAYILPTFLNTPVIPSFTPHTPLRLQLQHAQKPTLSTLKLSNNTQHLFTLNYSSIECRWNKWEGYIRMWYTNINTMQDNKVCVAR